MMKREMRILPVILVLFVPYLALSQSYSILKEMIPGSGGVWHRPITQLGDVHVFVAHDNIMEQLWVTDGTEENTRLILSTPSIFETDVPNRITKDGVFYFYWDRDATIYSFDGTTLTALATDVLVYRMNFFEDELYFIESSNSFNDQLMKVSDDPVNPISIVSLGDANTRGLTTYKGKMIIMAEKDQKTWLFESDGTAAGTIPFFELGERSNSNIDEQFTERDGFLYFYYKSNNVSELVPSGFYRTDGTNVGTVRLADIHNFRGAPGDRAENRSIWVDDILYTAGTNPDNMFGLELWVSDGTIEGTRLVKNLTGSSRDSDPKNFVYYNGNVYFSAKKENEKRAIWKTDGTEVGTTIVFDSIFSWSLSEYGEWLAVYDNQLVFSGFNSSEGSELWFSDGTEMGTRPVTDESAPGRNDFMPGNMATVNDLLYFNGWTSENGRELYVYSKANTTNVSPWDQNDLLSVKITPNPFRDKVTFTLDPSVRSMSLQLRCIDASGKVIWQEEISPSGVLELDLSNLAGGVYFYHLSLQDNNQILGSGKVVKR